MRESLCMRDTVSISEYIGWETLYIERRTDERHCVRHFVYARHYVNIKIPRMRDTVYE